MVYFMTITTKGKQTSEYIAAGLGFTTGIVTGSLFELEKMNQVLDVATIGMVGFRHWKGLDSEDSSVGKFLNAFGFSFSSGCLATQIARLAIRKIQGGSSLPSSSPIHRQNGTSVPPLFTSISYDVPVKITLDDASILGLRVTPHQEPFFRQVCQFEEQNEVDGGPKFIVTRKWVKEMGPVSYIARSSLACYQGSYFDIEGPTNGCYTITRRREKPPQKTTRKSTKLTPFHHL